MSINGYMNYLCEILYVSVFVKLKLNKSVLWVKRIKDLCIIFFYILCIDIGLCINRNCYLEVVVCIYMCILLCILIGLFVFYNFRKFLGIKFYISFVLRNFVFLKKFV